MTKTESFRWVVSVIVVLVVPAGVIAACSSTNNDNPNSGMPGSSTGAVQSPESCAHPNDNCPCDTPGNTADCGKTQIQVGDQLTCQMGHRTCTDGRWSVCQGDAIVTKSAPLGLHALALGVDASSDCIDLCDPYCSTFLESPSLTDASVDAGTDAGDFVITVDGGLTPKPSNQVDAGTLGGAVQVTSNGDSDCSGSPPNLHTGACSGDPITKCQQDFRCDPVGNSCVWNGGEGYYDTTAGGFDVTVGSACTYGGGASFPICNRGSAPIPSGSVVNLAYSTGTPSDSCATITPVCTGDVASDLAPGSCMNLLCNAPTGGEKFATISVTGEAAGRCGNNSAVVSVGPTCAACQSCNTTISGRVMDPGKNKGLEKVTVYEAAHPPATLTDFGASPVCDSCTALLDPTNFITAANTDTKGNFSMVRAAPGPMQLVSQTGRWRRISRVNLNACTNNSLSDDTLRLPKNRAEGDIPKMALVEGDRESLECWMAKVGIDSDEIWPKNGASPSVTGGGVTKAGGTDAARIHLYRTNGMGQASGRSTPPAGTTLWATDANLGQYSAVILPCDSTGVTPSATETTRMESYVKAGGRLFMDHLTGSAEWLNGSNAVSNWRSTATWQGNVTPPNPAITGYIVGGLNPVTDRNRRLYDWLAWNAPGTNGPNGAGWLEILNPRADGTFIDTSRTTTWILGRYFDGSFANPYTAAQGNQYTYVNPTKSNANATCSTGADCKSGVCTSHKCTQPDYTFALSYSFEETAAGAIKSAPDATTCGRVIYNGMHVSQTRAGPDGDPQSSTSVKFPTDCTTTALSSEEQALEYQFFQLTACDYTPPVVGSPPPAPGVPSSGNAVLTRTFTSSCPPGTRVEWDHFRWKADASGGSEIDFKARTAESIGDLPSAIDFDIGTANIASQSWVTDPDTVDHHFQNDLAPGTIVLSEPVLQVTMTFTSNGPIAPILYDWTAEFTCKPSE